MVFVLGGLDGLLIFSRWSTVALALVSVDVVVVLVEIRWHKSYALGIIYHVVMPVVHRTQRKVNYSYKDVILHLCSNKQPFW